MIILCIMGLRQAAVHIEPADDDDYDDHNGDTNEINDNVIWQSPIPPIKTLSLRR